MVAVYPDAVLGSPTATTYGLLQADKYGVSLVYHTTETSSWAGFKLGLTAPHYSYKASTRQWRWHGAPINKRVGTMRSSKRTGTPANEKSIQLEIICYSAKWIAYERPQSRVWVGDFTDDNYQDLADFAAWVASETDVDLSHVHAPPRGKSWVASAASPYRLDRDDWLLFDGLTAHGGVTGQTHWDTGVLNLERIAFLARGTVPPPPPPPDMEEDMLPLKYGDGFSDGQDLTYPPGHPQAGAPFTTDRRNKRSDVRAIQGMLADAGANVNLDGLYSVKTAQAVMAVTPITGADSNGYTFHGNDWAPVLKAAYGGSGGGGGDLSRGDTVQLN